MESPDETQSHTMEVLVSEITSSRLSELTLLPSAAISPFELSLLTGMMAHPRSSFITELSTSSVRMAWYQDHMI